MRTWVAGLMVLACVPAGADARTHVDGGSRLLPLGTSRRLRIAETVSAIGRSMEHPYVVH